MVFNCFVGYYKVKTGLDIMIVHFYIRIKLDIIRYDNFSVWMRTSSNPADNNRFRSHNGKEKLTSTRQILNGLGRHEVECAHLCVLHDTGHV